MALAKCKGEEIESLAQLDVEVRRSDRHLGVLVLEESSRRLGVLIGT